MKKSNTIAATSPRKRIELNSPSGVDIRHGLFKNDLQIRHINVSNRTINEEKANNADKSFLICISAESKKYENKDNCTWYASNEVDAFFNSLQVVFQQKHVTCWVDVDFSCLSEINFEKLCNILNLHETTMRDCLIEDRTVTDTKITQLEKYLFCIVDTLQSVECSSNDDMEKKNSKIEWETKNMNIILYNKGVEETSGVVTMHNGFIDGPDEIYSRIVNGHKGIVPSSEWILWAMFDVLTESLVPRIDLTDATVFEIEKDSVPTALDDQSVDQSAILHEIKISRRRLGQLKRSLSSKLELLSN